VIFITKSYPSFLDEAYTSEFFWYPCDFDDMDDDVLEVLMTWIACILAYDRAL
jgi:hypothetical protein